MPKYKVCFDGKWQGTFDDEREALDWAHEVGETGRIVHVVVMHRISGPELIAVFPEDRVAEGQQLWKERLGGWGLLSGGGPG